MAEIESRDAQAREAVGDHMPATIDTPISAATGDPTGRIEQAREQQPPGDSKYVETTVSISQTPDRKTTIRSKKLPTTITPEPTAPAGYEVLGQLGKGGMGIVYKARHIPLNRIVAIKMILGGKHASPETLSRFRQEAEAAAHLTHPNIVSVYEVGEYQGMPYFSLEYVDGLAMSALLSEASLSSKRSAELMEQVSRAVHYSHQQGVIHRDLKPSNILITRDGDPKVADFGLAKRLDDEDQDQTRTGQILGTPGFMAPEQARGEKLIGPRTDVYALGAILYNMLTGRAPFVAPTPIETIQQVVSEDPVPPSRLQSNLDRDLETICLKCLDKEPNRRYANAADLADELQRVQQGKPILARPITARERLVKWCRRNPRVATLSGIAASLLLTLLCGGYISAAVINQQKIAETAAKVSAQESEALAEFQADLALDATRMVLYQTQEFFRSKPEYNELRNSMLAGILQKIEGLYAERQDYDVKETFRASAIRQLGQIYFEAGRFEQALEQFLESERIALKLQQEGRLARPHLNFATLDLSIGDTQKQLGNLDQAERRYLGLIEHREKYFASQPSIDTKSAEQSMAQAYGRLGELYLLNRKVELALPLIQRSLDARRKRYEAFPSNLQTGEELSGALRGLSNLYEQTGQFPEMITASEQALKLLRRSSANKSDFPTVANMAGVLKQLGRQYQLAGDRQNAESRLRESVTQFEAALSQSPGNGRAQAGAADSYYLLAQLLFRSGQDHSQQCERGIALCDLLLAKSQSVANRVLKLKFVALSGQVEQASKLADQIAGEHTDEEACLYGAIGYAMAADHCDDPQKQELLDKALDCVRDALKLGFRQFVILRTDLDFEPLQKLDAYQQLLDAAENE